MIAAGAKASARRFEDVTFIVPTLDEAQTLPRLLEELGSRYPGAWVIVADDDSSDGTRERARAYDGPLHVHVLHRQGTTRGLTASVVDALKLVRTPHFVVMDADLQHPPEAALEIYKHASNGSELAVGKRVDYERFTPGRRVISTGARRLTDAYLRMRGGATVSDPMSGFFGGKTRFAQEVLRRHEEGFEKPGFKVLVDLLKFSPRGTRVSEVPYVFGERAAGRSKLSFAHTASLLRQLGPVGRVAGSALVMATSPAFWKFALVGLSGVLVNQAALYALAIALAWPLLLASPLAIGLSILWNFFWNDRWTFDGQARHVGAWTRLARFQAHCLVGAALNLATVLLLVQTAGMGILAANLVGIALAVTWNWAFSRRWTWRAAAGQPPAEAFAPDARPPQTDAE